MRGLCTANGRAVPAEEVLSQWLGQNIGCLLVSGHVMNLDEAKPDMFPKMMVAHVDVLRSRAKLGQAC